MRPKFWKWSCFLFTVSIVGGLVALASGQDGKGSSPARSVDPAREVTHAPSEPPRSFWSDYDRDGYPDLYVMGTEGADRLLRNDGDGFFRDVTVELGLSDQFVTAQVLWQDHDADQWPDLMLLSKAGALRLYHNERGLAFREISGRIGLEDVPGAATAQWIDYDRDGELDLMLQTTRGDAVFFHARPDRSFERIKLPGPVAALESLPGLDEFGRSIPAVSLEADPPPAPDSPTRTAGTLTIPGNPGGRIATQGSPASPPPGIEDLQRACIDKIGDAANPGNCLRASSVPTPGMLFPLTEDFLVDEQGNLAVTGDIEIEGGLVIGGESTFAARTGPPPRLHSRASVLDEDAILGEALQSNGVGRGVVGMSQAGMGEGVHGEASSTTGVTRGVCGVSHSSAGEGMRGEATATTGATRGVMGKSDSDAGEGMRGEASSTTGATRGVSGVSHSNAGEGMRGEATATTGATRGVMGKSDSDAGEGMRGEASSMTGATRGVSGVSHSNAGEGMRGEATATTGATRGITGISLSAAGEGVHGHGKTGVCGVSDDAAGKGVVGAATGTGSIGVEGTGTSVGVHGDGNTGVNGHSSNTTGRGVIGQASGANGIGVEGTSFQSTGVRGVSNGAGGEGVRGEASAEGGRGVCGVSHSNAGEGVLGEVTATTGDNVGVRGLTASSEGRGVEGIGPREGVHGIATYELHVAQVGVRGTSNVAGIGVVGECPAGIWQGLPTGVRTGVHGIAGASADPSCGVRGTTNDDDGYGVLGEATDPSGSNVGVRGISSSNVGDGVSGEALSTIGVTRGVYGITHSPDGVGVEGEASSPNGVGVKGVATGDGIGIYGSNTDVTGLAGMFEGEVEITGQLTVDDGAVAIGGLPGGAAGLELRVLGNDNWDMRSESVGDFTINRGHTMLRIEESGRVSIGTDDPTSDFDLMVNGTAGKPGGGSWSNSSDVRLKKNIHDLEGALETLLALRGVTFEYKDPEAIHELPGQRIGFIAQEVETVLPDWVDEGENGYKRLTVRGFEALAVEALREVVTDAAMKDARIGELEARNAVLEHRVTRLEALEAELASLRSALQAVLEAR